MTETNEIYMNAIQIKNSEVHGRGVFASKIIKKDDLIEVAPLIRLEWKLKYQYDRIIRDYCWMNSKCDCQDCKMHGPALYLAMGYGSMYNHHDEPNTKIKLDYNNLQLIIMANRDIQQDEEIFVSYGERYFKTSRRRIATQQEETKKETNETESEHT